MTITTTISLRNPRLQARKHPPGLKAVTSLACLTPVPATEKISSLTIFWGRSLTGRRRWKWITCTAKKGASEKTRATRSFSGTVIGQLTLAGEFGYDAEHQPKIPGGSTDAKDNDTKQARGFENVDLAVYHPIFQAVSRDNRLDYTAAIRLDVGIPTDTAVSGSDVQLTPYLGQLLRVGEHVSVETWTGAEFTIAPHQTDQFIYGASFGYQLTHKQMSLPFTESVTPLFELDGRTPFSHPGQDALFGVVGLNWQFTGKGNWQPRLGLGYQFPIDQGARDQLHWGIITQIFLQF